MPVYNFQKKGRLRTYLVIIAAFAFIAILAVFILYRLSYPPIDISYKNLPPSEKENYVSSCSSIDFSSKKFIKIPFSSLYRSYYGIPYNRIISNRKLIWDRWLSGLGWKRHYYSVKPDKKVIKIYHALLEYLRNEKYDDQAVYITSFIRTPHYNAQVGGAKCSRHQHGDAIDIKIGDINKDGYSDQKDVEIIYDYLDRALKAGGLGRYKSYPMILHFDTRGKKARWK